MRAVSHVYKRLGIGPNHQRVATSASPEVAIGALIVAARSPIEIMPMDPPSDQEEYRDVARIAELAAWWLEQMAFSPDPLTERLTWFWHDHFATSIRKVRAPYLMWLQHRTIRRLALEPFSELLAAMAKDPAMLVYLDGAQNNAEAVNENFAREVMELHTLGTGEYSQTDITEAARALTGWLLHIPFNRRVVAAAGDVPEWESFFFGPRHVAGSKSVLGVSGDHDLDSVVELLVEHPATQRRIASKLFDELVARPPTLDELEHLTSKWSTTEPTGLLVEAIVELPAFLDSDQFDARIKTPIERLVGLVQAYGNGIPAEASYALHNQSYLPFNPPNPAGFPKGDALLGPHQLVHAFDFLNVIEAPTDARSDEVFERLGLYDVSDVTQATVEAAAPIHRVPLAVNSPEYALT
ncbi:MAG: DUF1800 domain-containing protein [Acidimicrobiia bacterium]|nr:DUF1800 domain-containing protein [Acidimicrobiia bacterium]